MKLAVIVTRGSTNNLFQAATLVRAATALDYAVDVLFRDEALVKLRRDRLNLAEWSAAYAPVRENLEERLRAAEFTDMETFLRDAKEHGDAVRFWACTDTLAAEQLTLEKLVPLVDGAITLESFLDGARGADAVLRF